MDVDFTGRASAAAAVLAWRRSPLAPPMVLLAGATLALELLVQIPFLRLSLLQAIFGTLAGRDGGAGPAGPPRRMVTAGRPIPQPSR